MWGVVYFDQQLEVAHSQLIKKLIENFTSGSAPSPVKRFPCIWVRAGIEVRRNGGRQGRGAKNADSLKASLLFYSLALLTSCIVWL